MNPIMKKIKQTSIIEGDRRVEVITIPFNLDKCQSIQELNQLKILVRDGRRAASLRNKDEFSSFFTHPTSRTLLFDENPFMK